LKKGESLGFEGPTWGGRGGGGGGGKKKGDVNLLFHNTKVPREKGTPKTRFGGVPARKRPPVSQLRTWTKKKNVFVSFKWKLMRNPNH